MASDSAIPPTQHNIEIFSNRRAWERKPLLQEIYGDFYRTIAAELRPELPGLTVELGSGMGNIKQVIPDCITTDLFPNPWLDRQENAYTLSFSDASVANLILFDVWHHLEFPGSALQQFARVLTPGGRLILFEPATSLLGRLIYGLFHHEPLGFGKPIAWKAPAHLDLANAPYFAAQAFAWRIFVRREFGNQLDVWHLRKIHPFASLSYVASGGFSKPQLFPTACLPLMRQLDRALSTFPKLFATRLLIVLEKRGP